MWTSPRPSRRSSINAHQPSRVSIDVTMAETRFVRSQTDRWVSQTDRWVSQTDRCHKSTDGCHKSTDGGTNRPIEVVFLCDVMVTLRLLLCDGSQPHIIFTFTLSAFFNLLIHIMCVYWCYVFLCIVLYLLLVFCKCY